MLRVLSILWVLAGAVVPSANAIDINGRCYPNPILLGVNDQGGEDATLIHNANLRWVRITLVWRDINPAFGSWTWGPTDALVNAHFNKGHKILGILSTAPMWAGSNDNGTTPPSDISYWEEFVRQVSIRYRGKVQAYEIWNEPDYRNLDDGVGWNKSLWNYPTYADYIRAAAIKIRANAPGALVVAPSLGSDPRAETVDVFRHLEDQPLPEGNASYFIYKEIDDTGSSRGIHRLNFSPKPVVTQYLQTLPSGGIFPPAGYNAEGYKPMSVSCSGRTCTFTSGYSPNQWRVQDWRFGDGATATGYQVVHTHAKAGNYHVFHGTLGILEWPTDTAIVPVN